MHSAHQGRCAKSTGHRAARRTPRTAEAELSNAAPIAHSKRRARSARGCAEAGMEVAVPAVPARLAAGGGRHGRGENLRCTELSQPVSHSLTNRAIKPQANPVGSAPLFAFESRKAETVLILGNLSL